MQISRRGMGIFFYVQKGTLYNSTSSPIPFEIEKLNTGGAMNLASGVFTAPKSGTYFFSFSGVAHISASSSAPLRLGLFIHLYRNGIAVGSGEADDYSVTDEHETTSIHIQSTLDLKIGDRIWLTKIADVSQGVYLDDTINQLTHFTGWLVQEKMNF